MDIANAAVGRCQAGTSTDPRQPAALKASLTSALDTPQHNGAGRLLEGEIDTVELAGRLQRL
jgi:hypothetical protein